MSSVAAEGSGLASRPEPEAGRGRSRRRLIIAAVATLAVAAAAVTVSRLTSRSGSQRATSHTATTTATVQRINLAETTPVNGTVGFAGPVPGGPNPQSIVQPAGTPPSALNQDQQSVTSAQQTLGADQQAAADANTADAQTVAQAQQTVSTARATLSADTTTLLNDQATLTADEQKETNDCQGSGAARSGSSGSGASGSGGSGSSSACAADEAQVASGQKTVTADQEEVTSDEAAVNMAQGQVSSARQKAAQASDQARAKLAADQLNLSDALSVATNARTSQTAYDQTSMYTALPAVGQIIQRGQALWSIDGHPVVLIPGTLTPWRAFTAGMTAGPDVAALDQALIALGDGAGLSVSSNFTDPTAVAIDRLQATLGEPPTGTLPLGSVIFEPTALRVTTVHPLIGGPVSAGAPVLDVTSTTPIVNVALPVDQSSLVKVGDPVSVELPDDTTTQGTISAVGTVATNTTPSSGSSSSSPSATMNVTVTMPHAPGAASLDQAPVTVNITNATADNVLAVPTPALLALAGGGEAVEVVDPNGSHRLVGVTTGIFDDQGGMVQVSGAGLAAGQSVVAAA